MDLQKRKNPVSLAALLSLVPMAHAQGDRSCTAARQFGTEWNIYTSHENPGLTGAEQVRQPVFPARNLRRHVRLRFVRRGPIRRLGGIKQRIERLAEVADELLFR